VHLRLTVVLTEEVHHQVAQAPTAEELRQAPAAAAAVRTHQVAEVLTLAEVVHHLAEVFHPQVAAAVVTHQVEEVLHLEDDNALLTHSGLN
jgi:hypothetical protein